MGVGRTRLYQVLERLRELGLVIAVDVEGLPLPGPFTDRGLAVLARRDRTAVGLARQRWSAAPVKPEVADDLVKRPRLPQPPVAAQPGPHPGRSHGSWPCWRINRVAQGCADAYSSTRPGGPPASSPTTTAIHSVRPDAFGVLKPTTGRSKPFFLEWERRAVRPTTMAARIAPYMRYYATNRPLDDHGVVPAGPGGLRRRPGRRPLRAVGGQMK